MTERPPHSSLKYRPDVDGLRAIAVTSVVAFHAGLGMRGGFVGVDIFFVISGYLIGSLVYKEIRGHSFRLPIFYSRRVKRILPALFGVLLFTYAGAVLLLSPQELRTFAPTAAATILSGANVWFWHSTGNYFSQRADLNPLLMTWTLGVEEQFYIFLPLLLIAMRKLRAVAQIVWISALVLLSFAASVWTTAHHPGMAFYLLPARAWELGSGVLLAMLEANRIRAPASRPSFANHLLSLAGLVSIAVAIFTFSEKTSFPGSAALLPVIGALLIIAARRGVVNRVLSLKPVVFIGLVSYSWYLWHWPLLSFARISSTTQISTTAGAVIAVLSFGCAVLSYRFIEQPFRASTTALAPLFRRYAVAGAALLALPLALFVTHGLPRRYALAASMETEPARYFNSNQCLMPESVTYPNLRTPCVPLRPVPAIALIGDSHAGALARVLQRIAERSGFRLMELDKEDCPALVGVSRYVPSMPRHQDECTLFNRRRLDFILQHPEIHAVIIAGFWSKPFRHAQRGERYVAEGQNGARVSQTESIRMFEEGLTRMVTRLRLAGKTVYLVQDNPLFPFDPLQHMRIVLIRPRARLASWLGDPVLKYHEGVAPNPELPSDDIARAVVSRVAASRDGVQVIDPQAALCSSGRCRFAYRTNTLYADAGHLDRLGAETALQGFSLPPAD